MLAAGAEALERVALALARQALGVQRPAHALECVGCPGTPQEVVAENLLLLQVAFLREALGIT